MYSKNTWENLWIARAFHKKGANARAFNKKITFLLEPRRFGLWLYYVCRLDGTWGAFAPIMSATVSQSKACTLLLLAQVDFHWTRLHIKFGLCTLARLKAIIWITMTHKGRKRCVSFFLR